MNYYFARYFGFIVIVIGTFFSTSSLMAQLSVTATAGNATPSALVIGGTVTSSLIATPNNPPTADEGCTLNAPTWAWTYTVAYASTLANATAGAYGGSPGGCSVTISPSSSSSATLNATFTTAGYWQITATATVTYTDTCGTDYPPASGAASVTATVVGITKLQFQLNGGTLTDMPGTLYVANGNSVTFTAIPNPTDASFPAGYAIWGGSCGASGTGATASVTPTTFSESMSDTQTVTATCGTDVKNGNIIFAGPDSGSVSLDFATDDPGSYYAYSSYTLWAPDADGDGQPDSSTAELFSIPITSFDGYDPADPAALVLGELGSWSYTNGLLTTQETLIQSGIEYTESDYDASLSGDSSDSASSGYDRREGSLYAALAQSSDTASVLCQAGELIEVIAVEIGKDIFVAGVEEFLKDVIAKELEGVQPATVTVTPPVLSVTGWQGEIKLTLSLATTATAGAKPVIFNTWVYQPAVTAVLSADPPILTLDTGGYKSHMGVVIWTPSVNVRGGNGWAKNWTLTALDTWIGGRSKAIKNNRSSTYGCAYWFPGFGSYKTPLSYGLFGPRNWQFPDALQGTNGQLECNSAAIAWPL